MCRMRTAFEDLPTRARPGVRQAGPAPRRRKAIVAVLSVLAFALSLLVQFHVVPLHSDDRDEGVYIFQAEMLREGMLTLPEDEYGEFFRPWLSGSAEGRIFTEYQVGFPLFLAAADLLLGSMRLGLALVAALTVPAAYGFTRNLLGDRRVALWGAGLVALSPMTVLQSALFVTYSLTVLLLLAASWALLAAANRASVRLALAGGVLTGAALLVRPMDVVLWMVPVVVLAALRLLRRTDAGASALLRLGGVAVAGVVPAGLLTLWYNSRTTGGALRFPNMAADELNTFGFGTRRLVETEPTITYEVRDAISALWQNVAAVPSWLPGGILLVALAVVGFVVGGVRGERLAERVTLVALVAAFPAGYFFWWATVLSAEGARNGIGPHYYVPAMVALSLLAARGITAVVPPRALPVGATVVLLAVLTAWSLPDKLEDKRRVTRSFEQVHDAIPDDLTDAVVIVDYDGRPYVMSKYPFLRNDPRLEGDVIFAADRGPRNAALLERFPDRDVYLLRAAMRPGDELFVPSASFDRVERREGARLSFTMTASNLPPGRHVRGVLLLEGERRIWNAAAVGDGSDLEPTRSVELGTSDDVGTVTWDLVAGGADGEGGGDDAADDTLVLDGPTTVLVGVLHSTDPDLRDAEWSLEEHSVDVRGDRLVLLEPPRGHSLARFPTATLYLPEAIGTKLSVTADLTG